MNFLKRTYNWTLKKAEHKNAKWYLSLISFAESSFFPIPPDIILIPMIIAKRTKAFILAFICTIFSVLGGLFGYLIGFALFNSIGIILINFYGMNDYIESLNLNAELICPTHHSSELNEIFFETIDHMDCYYDPLSILR